MVKKEEGPQDANKYFFIMKMALDTRYTKLVSAVLHSTQVSIISKAFVS